MKVVDDDCDGLGYGCFFLKLVFFVEVFVVLFVGVVEVFGCFVYCGEVVGFGVGVEVGCGGD